MAYFQVLEIHKNRNHRWSYTQGITNLYMQIIKIKLKHIIYNIMKVTQILCNFYSQKLQKNIYKKLL